MFYIILLVLIIFGVWNLFLYRKISQLQAIRDFLSESEKHFRRAISNAPFPIMIHAEDGEVLEVNKIWTELTGYSHQDISTTKIWAEKAYGDKGKSILENVISKKYLLKSRWEEGDFTLKTKDGQECLWQFSSAPLGCLPDGRRVVVSMAVDITERQRIENALRESKEQYGSIYNQVAVGLANATLEGKFINVNPRWCEMLGYSREELLGKTVWEITHPDDREKISPAVHRLFAKEIPYFFQEKRYLRKDGSYFWATTGVSLVLDATGNPKHTLAVITNISERKQAEEALQDSEKRFRNIAANVPGAILQYVLHPDTSDAVTYVSPGCYDLWEVKAEVVIEDAQILWNMIHPDDGAAMYESVIHSAKTLESWFWQWRIITPSGKTKWLEAAGSPQLLDNGDIVWDTLIIDVSARKLAELALQETENRYRKVVEAQTDFILRLLPDTTITFANPSLCKVLGVTTEEIIGRKWSDFANPDDLQEYVLKKLVKLSPAHPRTLVENRDKRVNGEIGWTQWLNEGIFDEYGQLSEIQSVGRDITKLKKTEEALRASQELLSLITENMSDLVCLQDIDGNCLYITPSSQILLDYTPTELMGHNLYELVHPDDLEQVRRVFHQQLLTEQTLSVTYRMRKKTGDYIWLETITRRILPTHEERQHLQTTSRDVTNRIKVEEQLKYDALHDKLTGLPNRSLLMERLDLAIKRVKRNPQFNFAVLFLDLDNFKVINDSLGHLMGDKLLLTVASKLTHFIRETDLAARLGGDEFVILLEEVDNLEQAVAVAKRILEVFRSPFQISVKPIFTSTSIGIVMGTSSHQKAEELLRDADLAMYLAKQRGKNQYAIFTTSLHLKAVKRLHLENDLRKAFEHNEFLLYYQPIFNLQTDELYGFEALIRWQHPERGFISPTEFIPIAEETGLMVVLGQWILRTSSQQLAIWQSQFPNKSLKLSVNLSVKQLQNSLLKEVETILQQHTLENGSLTLEITESMLVENVEEVCQLLKQIKAKDINLSIDDFGTGYSCLSYLHQFPVDFLKIDRTFVSQALPKTHNQVIAESIIALSNSLNLNVIAEGIETNEQLQWLKQLGCKLGQGFFFSPPVSASQASELLNTDTLRATV